MTVTRYAPAGQERLNSPAGLDTVSTGRVCASACRGQNLISTPGTAFPWQTILPFTDTTGRDFDLVPHPARGSKQAIPARTFPHLAAESLRRNCPVILSSDRCRGAFHPVNTQTGSRADSVIAGQRLTVARQEEPVPGPRLVE